MAKAKFLCTSKTGVETFTVTLEPDPESVSPSCPECGQRTHEDYCVGYGTVVGKEMAHKPVELKEGDTSFFKDLPVGTIVLSVLTPEAAAQFEVGKLTEIDFNLVP